MSVINTHAGENPKITGYLYNRTATDRINLTGSDFVANSLAFRKSTSESGEITVGACIIDSCNFKLFDTNGKFDNWDWSNSGVSITLEFANGEQKYMGAYMIVHHKSNGNIITVEALDGRKIMDLHKIGEMNFTYPIDAVSAINQLAVFGIQGVTVGGLADLAGTLTVPDPNDDNMTNRDAIAYLAQCLGKFATFEQTAEGANTLLFSWYDLNSYTNVGNSFSHDTQIADITVTGVRVTANDDETIVMRGEEGYVLEISGNPFISTDNIDTVANNIEAAVVGLTFRPGTFSILSDPFISAGDTIVVSTPQDSNLKTIVTNLTYKPGYTRESVTADAPDSPDDLQVSPTDYIKKTIKSELNNPNSDLSQAIGGNEKPMWKMSRGYIKKLSSNINLFVGNHVSSQAPVVVLDSLEKSGSGTSETTAYTEFVSGNIDMQSALGSGKSISKGTEISLYADKFMFWGDNNIYPALIYHDPNGLNTTKTVYPVFVSVGYNSEGGKLSFELPMTLNYMDSIRLSFNIQIFDIRRINENFTF